jgi:SPX domain protein involved in polyphosphate accumulation
MYEPQQTFFLPLTALKARLANLEQPGLPHRKIRNIEQAFLEELNAEVVKVNDVCSKAVLEVDDTLRYLKRYLQRNFLSLFRKLSKKGLSLQHISVLQSECDTLLGDITQLEYYVSLSENSFTSVMKKHDSIIGAASSAWYYLIIGRR